MGKPATFNVQFNGAQGHLDARVVAPSGAEDEAALMEVEKGHYAVRFVPKENGTHQVVDEWLVARVLDCSPDSLTS